MKLTSGAYAYCIVELGKDKDSDAILPNDTFMIRFRDVGAIVSIVPKTSWQPTRKNISRHQKIISRIQEEFELLPLRFGTVFKNKQEVIEILEEHYQEIKRILNKVRDKVELGLRVLWNRDSFLNEVGNKKVEKLKKRYESGRKDRYLIALEVGRNVEETVIRKREDYERLILSPLAAQVDDSVLNPVSGEMMVLNAAFLIKKGKLSDFDQALEALSNKYKDKFTFRYSGPWPPYNFTKVTW